MHNVFAKMMAEVMPFRGPGNFRGNEVSDAFVQGTGALWLNKGTPKEIVPEVTRNIQAVLDMPRN
jgi:hypothetical protein